MTVTPLQQRRMIAITVNLCKFPIAQLFLKPVDQSECPDYYKTIKRPMCLELVRQKLQDGTYQTAEQWKADINLIWKNGKSYNQETTVFFKMAEELRLVFQSMADTVPRTETEAWVLNLRKYQAKLTDMVQYL
jgi:histone acetyltransferase